jgi:hypothetical protein
MQALLQWASANFTVEIHMTTTKIQGILWSAADIALVYYFLKIAVVCAAATASVRMTRRLWLLWLSAFLTPFLLFTKTQDQYFILDSIICGIQYLLLLYTLLRSGKDMMAYFLGATAQASSSISADEIIKA